MTRRCCWLLALAACTTQRSAVEAGADLFADPKAFSSSEFNTVSCASCHQTGAQPIPGRRDAGYSLRGAAARRAYWGGNELRLLDAVDACVVYFQRGMAIDPQSVPSRELYEYLLSVTPDDAEGTQLPFTVVENIQPLPKGDATRGEVLFQQACVSCHGEAHTGKGNIIQPRPVIMPEYTDGYDMFFPGVPHGLLVIEKIRHGRFFHVGGTMPLYSKETMTDEEIGDLLAFLGLAAE